MANINEWSYQRYARFYGKEELKDEEFNNKVEIIKNMILNDKITNLYEIAAKSNCTYEECILKICYLKNKRVLENYYIDSAAGLVSVCNDEEVKLLKKYEVSLYGNHSSIDEMTKELEMSEEDIWKELKYLDSRKLLNGVILDEVDKKIIYYSVEKHKFEKDYVTVNCKSCGALVDVQRGSKVRCEHCNTIVEDNQIEEAIEKVLNKNK